MPHVPFSGFQMGPREGKDVAGAVQAVRVCVSVCVCICAVLCAAGVGGVFVWVCKVSCQDA